MTPSSREGPFDNSALDWSRIRRVLLVRLRSIGDTVLMTPCLEALKNWKPELEVSVLSEPLAAPLLEDHPLVDNLLVVEPEPGSRARAIVRLRHERFDAAFNIHGGSTGTLLCALSGAQQTVGWRDYSLSWLLDKRLPGPDAILGRSSIHSVEQQLAMLHASGVPWPRNPSLSLRVSPEAETAVLRWRSSAGIETGRGFACLAPAAADPAKQWPSVRFAAVADHLMEQWNLPSVIVVGLGEENFAGEVAAASRAPNIPIACRSLKESMALIAQSRVFVGNDSGPMHIASAFSRPLVAIFGASRTDVWRPWTDASHSVIAPPAGDPLHANEPAINKITVEEVIGAVDAVLAPSPAAVAR